MLDVCSAALAFFRASTSSSETHSVINWRSYHCSSWIYALTTLIKAVNLTYVRVSLPLIHCEVVATLKKM